jgi:hypothetical protein
MQIHTGELPTFIEFTHNRLRVLGRFRIDGDITWPPRGRRPSRRHVAGGCAENILWCNVKPAAPVLAVKPPNGYRQTLPSSMMAWTGIIGVNAPIRNLL